MFQSCRNTRHEYNIEKFHSKFLYLKKQYGSQHLATLIKTDDCGLYKIKMS